MIDKQIIDGVDVSGCDELCGTKCHILMASCNSSKHDACEEFPNCNYKKSKRLEQTIEECHKYQAQLEDELERKDKELQEVIDNYVKLDLQRVKEYNELVDKYNSLKKNYENLEMTSNEE